MSHWSSIPDSWLYIFFSASGLAPAGQCRVRFELSYLLVGALFERNQFLNQKPINVIDCIKAVDGEVRVPRVDSLKRHVLKRFQKVNSFESIILKDLSKCHRRTSRTWWCYDWSYQPYLYASLLNCLSTYEKPATRWLSYLRRWSQATRIHFCTKT